MWTLNQKSKSQRLLADMLSAKANANNDSNDDLGPRSVISLRVSPFLTIQSDDCIQPSPSCWKSLPVVAVVQSLSHVWLFVTPWTAACQASPSFTISWSLLKLMSIELMIPTNHLILCHLLLFLPFNFPSIRDFSNKSARRIRWPKYWTLNFSISPSNEYLRLISFRTDWFDLLAVRDPQGFSPAPQFRSISSLVLSLLYSPTLSFVHDYWKNHSFDYTDLCQQSVVSAF